VPGLTGAGLSGNPNLDINSLLGMFGGLGTIMGNTPEGKFYDAPVKEPSLVFLASEKSA
jgi:hypothetical protein